MKSFKNIDTKHRALGQWRMPRPLVDLVFPDPSANSTSTTPAAPPQMSAPPTHRSFASTLSWRLRETFGQDENADLTIICKGREWKVCKMILCLSSEVFKKMICGECKVSYVCVRLQSHIERCCRMAKRANSSWTTKTRTRWISYFATCTRSHTAAEPNRLILNMRVAKIADVYDVESLQRDAINDLGSVIQVLWSEEDFPDAIAEVYSHDGYDQVREILAQTAVRRLETFREDLEGYEPFWNAVATYHQFAIATLRASPTLAFTPPLYKRSRIEDGSDMPAKRVHTSGPDAM